MAALVDTARIDPNARKRNQVVAMNVCGDRVDRREFARDLIAMNRQRKLQGFAIARLDRDDDLLPAVAAALDRLAKRFVEFGGFDRLCAGSV